MKNARNNDDDNSGNDNNRHELHSLWGLYGGLILAVLIIYGSLVLAVKHVRHFNPADFDQALLDNVKSHPDDLSMVVFGNSRTRNALSGGIDPDVPVILPDGRRMRVIQYAGDAALFDFYKPLLPDVLAARPDYIVILDVLLTNNRSFQSDTVTGYAHMVYFWLEDILRGVSPEEKWQQARAQIIDMCVDRYDAHAVKDQLSFSESRDQHSLDANNPNLKTAREFIAQAMDHGIKVVILRLPYNEAETRKFNVPGYKINYHGLDHTPTHEEQLPLLHDKVQWLDYGPVPSEQFCDFIHLNDSGRSAFEKWFWQKF